MAQSDQIDRTKVDMNIDKFIDRIFTPRDPAFKEETRLCLDCGRWRKDGIVCAQCHSEEFIHYFDEFERISE